MDGVQLYQGYRATKRKQFTFYHEVPRKSWYSLDRPRKDERLSQIWSHPICKQTNTYYITGPKLAMTISLLEYYAYMCFKTYKLGKSV